MVRPRSGSRSQRLCRVSASPQKLQEAGGDLPEGAEAQEDNKCLKEEVKNLREDLDCSRKGEEPLGGEDDHQKPLDRDKAWVWCVCVCVDTGVDILPHMTAGGPMPTRKDGAEKEMTVAMAMPS